MERVGLQLLICHIGLDHSRKTSQVSCLVVGCITPTISLFSSALAGSNRFSCLQVSIVMVFLLQKLTSLRTTAALLWFSRATIAIIRRSIAELPASPKWDVVGASDTLISPRHFEDFAARYCEMLQNLISLRLSRERRGEENFKARVKLLGKTATLNVARALTLRLKLVGFLSRLSLMS